MNNLKLKEIRTQGTVESILSKTKKLDVNFLLGDIFVWTENNIAQKMIKLYESQLILACLKPKEFASGLHSFYQKTAIFITENHLEKEFVSFAYFIYSTISQKKKFSDDSLCCYLDMLMQQYNYFVIHPNLVYGLDTQNRWLMKSEPFPYIDTAYLDLSERDRFDRDKLYKSYNKYGYNVNSPLDMLSLQKNDQLITNVLLTMTNFINEYTQDIVPKDYFLVAHGFNAPRRVNATNIYKELLREKRYFLPSKGVKGVYHNSVEIAEILFQEIFTENRIILLYKVTDRNGKGFSGFYDNKLELFFSPWNETDGGKIFHNNIENFVLESYCYLTTDIEEKECELNLQKRLHVIKKNEAEKNISFPTVKFMYQSVQNEQPHLSTDEFRVFDKKKYKEIKMPFGGRPRKLPVGSQASDEALLLAKEYNYIIRPGETFVKPFERRVYIKTNDIT